MGIHLPAGLPIALFYIFLFVISSLIFHLLVKSLKMDFILTLLISLSMCTSDILQISNLEALPRNRFCLLIWILSFQLTLNTDSTDLHFNSMLHCSDPGATQTNNPFLYILLSFQALVLHLLAEHSFPHFLHLLWKDIN